MVFFSFFFFRNGRRRRRRQPTDGEEQQFPEEYPDLRGSSRISNKFSAKHVTNELRGTGPKGGDGGGEGKYYIRIYTVVENFNYLTAHNPVMTRDTYTHLPHSLSLLLPLSLRLLFSCQSPDKYCLDISVRLDLRITRASVISSETLSGSKRWRGAPTRNDDLSRTVGE